MPADRTQIFARTKRIGDSVFIEVPPKELEKLGIGEDEPVIIYLQKYGTVVMPRLKSSRKKS